MAGKVINTVLNLRDNLSGGLIKAAQNTQAVTKEMVSATREVERFRKKAVSAVSDVVKTTAKAAAGGITALTAAFFAMDGATEEYRIAQGKLNTAYEAADLGAKTAAAAYEEFYKILGNTDTATEASQLLAKLAKDEQGVARWTRISAGVSGTFGDSLPIEGLIEASNETVKVGQVTGVLADALNWVGIKEDAFNERLSACTSEAERNQLITDTLAQTYESAADAFYRNNKELIRSRANQTAMANVTAKVGKASQIAKNGLMQMLGVQEDGSLRAGSALEWLSEKADLALSQFERWQQDGTLDAIAQRLDQGLAKGAELAGQAFQWLQANGDTLLARLKPLAATIAAFKLAKLGLDTMNAVNNFALYAKTVTLVTRANVKATASWVKNTAAMVANKAGIIATTVASKAAAVGTGLLTAAQWALNAAFVATPIGWIVLGIMAVVAAGVALYKNWDTVKETATALWERAKGVFGGIRDTVTGAFTSAREAVGGFFDWIGEKLTWLDGKIESIPVLGDVYKGVKGAGSWIADTIQGHALGTTYFAGGLTKINERGGEILDLPSGTRIIPHDVSNRMVTEAAKGGVLRLTTSTGESQRDVVGVLMGIRSLLEQLLRKRSTPSLEVYVTIQGNVIGSREYADSLGDIIARRILRALDNI